MGIEERRNELSEKTTKRSGSDVLLELSPLISQLSNLSEKDADLARKGLAEIIQVPAEYIPRQMILTVLFPVCIQAYFGGAG